MSNPASLKFSGFEELQRNLQKLPENMQNRAYRSVLTSGGRVIASAAKKKIPTHRTGLLKKSIRAKWGVIKGTHYTIIGPTRSVSGTHKGKRVVPANYSHLVEYGTAHGKAKPFMRPAMDESGGAVMNKMAHGLNRFMDREVAKLKKKGKRK